MKVVARCPVIVDGAPLIVVQRVERGSEEKFLIKAFGRAGVFDLLELDSGEVAQRAATKIAMAIDEARQG